MNEKLMSLRHQMDDLAVRLSQAQQDVNRLAVMVQQLQRDKLTEEDKSVIRQALSHVGYVCQP